MSLKKLKRLKLFFVGFFVFQAFFSFFGRQLLGVDNIFPFYTWKIFHVRPDKVLDMHYISIIQIDDQIFDPPIIDLNVVVEKFPHMQKYTLAEKINSYGNSGVEERKIIVEHLNKLFTLHHDYVRWSVEYLKYDPIDYYWEKKFLQRNVLGTYEANKDVF